MLIYAVPCILNANQATTIKTYKLVKKPQEPEQLELNFNMEGSSVEKISAFNDPAFVGNKKLPIHRWVPWIAGFSQSFVQGVLESHVSDKGGVVLDPFAGVGTTLVEAYRLGHTVVGFEINPYAHLAARVKLSVGDIPISVLRREVGAFIDFYRTSVRSGRVPQSVPPSGFRTRIPFYSDNVLKKVLYVFDFIDSLNTEIINEVFKLAFASTMVRYSNYSYEPSLATRASSGKQNILDYPVGEVIFEKLSNIVDDTEWFQAQYPNSNTMTREVVHGSFFDAGERLGGNLIDLVITSPPYLNNYHYNRNTRPHLYWLGYAQRPSDFKPLEEANFGTYWQTVRELERVNLEFTLTSTDLHERIELLRETNVEKGVYGGNGWANYAAKYFNDCFSFSQQLQRILKPGGRAVVVIGNSILQGILIPTDQYLAKIAEYVGLEIEGIDIPRSTRVGNSIIQSDVRSVKAKKKDQLYEAVVTLKKSR